MHSSWHSNLPNSLKLNLFKSTKCTAQRPGPSAHASINASTVAMPICFAKVLGLSWRSYTTLSEIYGTLLRQSTCLGLQGAQFAGHCFRAKGELISKLLWKLAGRGHFTFPQVIARDTEINLTELGTAMGDPDLVSRPRPHHHDDALVKHLTFLKMFLW